MIIQKAFDSHAHWALTGEWLRRLPLHNLQDAKDVSSLRPGHEYFMGEWLLGFGWDHNRWHNKELPTRQILDQAFPLVPVYFIRADGHGVWVNSLALKRAHWIDDMGNLSVSFKNMEGIVKDACGFPTGVLLDTAMNEMEKSLPVATKKDVRENLLRAMNLFNSEGITHIRDMGCGPLEWDEARNLDERKCLSLAAEMSFVCMNPSKELDGVLSLSSHESGKGTKNVRFKGIKVFADGALGSEGAWLGTPYANRSDNWRGSQFISDDILEMLFRKSWEKKLEVSVHALGDEAVHQVVKCACKLFDQGFTGPCHIEHVQMLRDETLLLMRGRPFVIHMQPLHWLSDRHWIKNKIGNREHDLFRWNDLILNGLPVFFGSDSPIERPSLIKTLVALNEAQKNGISAPTGNIIAHLSHPDEDFANGTFTRIVDSEIKEVVFRGIRLEGLHGK